MFTKYLFFTLFFYIKKFPQGFVLMLHKNLIKELKTSLVI